MIHYQFYSIFIKSVCSWKLFKHLQISLFKYLETLSHQFYCSYSFLHTCIRRRGLDLKTSCFCETSLSVLAFIASAGIFSSVASVYKHHIENKHNQRQFLSHLYSRKERSYPETEQCIFHLIPSGRHMRSITYERTLL